MLNTSTQTLVPVLPIAKLMPGETIWSAVARTHLMLGGKSVKATLELLFGAGIKFPPSQLLPARLMEFVKQAGNAGVRLTPMRLLCEHTGLPYFTYFHGLKQRMEVQARIFERRGPARVRALLGLQKMRGVSTRSVPAYCPECAAREYEHIGFAYWHLVHQLPIVVVCPFHGCALRIVLGGSEGRAPSAFDLYLPPMPGGKVVQLSRPVEHPADLSPRHLRTLAERACSLLNDPPRPCEAWHAKTRRRLKLLGYRTTGGLDYVRLSADIVRYFGNALVSWVGLKDKHGPIRTQPFRGAMNLTRGRQPTPHYLFIEAFADTASAVRSGTPND